MSKHTFSNARRGIDMIDSSMSNVICICLINHPSLCSIRYPNCWLISRTIIGQFRFEIVIFYWRKKQIRNSINDFRSSMFNSHGNDKHLFISRCFVAFWYVSQFDSTIIPRAVDISLKSYPHLSWRIQSMMIAFSTSSIDLSLDHLLTTSC